MTALNPEQRAIVELITREKNAAKIAKETIRAEYAARMALEIASIWHACENACAKARALGVPISQIGSALETRNYDTIKSRIAAGEARLGRIPGAAPTPAPATSESDNVRAFIDLELLETGHLWVRTTGPVPPSAWDFESPLVDRPTEPWQGEITLIDRTAVSGANTPLYAQWVAWRKAGTLPQYPTKEATK